MTTSASSGSLQGSGTAKANPITELNINLADVDVFVAVPEFGFYTGAIALVGSVGSYAFIRKRKKAII